jgi:hypothetical protein
MSRRILVVVAAALVTSVSAREANAQAWVPAKGEGAVSVLYQNRFVEDHFLAGGARIDRGEIQSNNLLFDVTYGLTDRLTVTMVLPFVRTQYRGGFRHPSDVDNGQPHSGFQNVSLGARYNILDSAAITITPFIGTNMPTHNYEYFAHAAFGTRVRELEVGLYAGRMIGGKLPNTFVQARYAYSFAEEIVNIHHDRSTLDVEVGQFVTPSLRVFLMGSGQTTHGGIDTPDAGWRAMPVELGEHHDRVARLQMLDVGGGVQFSVNRSVDVFASFVKTLAGRNAHALSRGLTVGASWSFGRASIASLFADRREPSQSEPKQALIRCLCQK